MSDEAEVVKKATKKRTVKPKLVKMVRDDREADVHPDMVEDYSKGGWTKK